MHTVASRLVGSTLQGIQELTGKQYAQILKQAGLSRLEKTLPSLNSDLPLASGEEIALLYKAIYDIVGESVLRLFLRNLGYKLFELGKNFPAFIELKAKLEQLPPEERLESGLDIFVPNIARLIGGIRIVSSDADNFYVTLKLSTAKAGRFWIRTSSPLGG